MPVMETGPAPSDRTRVRRHPERGGYDRATIDAILDEALICHVAWVGEDGGPHVIPTIHARDGDTLYIHGSQASRTLRALRADLPLCLEATLIDGLVLARSTFTTGARAKIERRRAGATRLSERPPSPQPSPSGRGSFAIERPSYSTG